MRCRCNQNGCEQNIDMRTRIASRQETAPEALTDKAFGQQNPAKESTPRVKWRRWHNRGMQVQAARQAAFSFDSDLPVHLYALVAASFSRDDIAGKRVRIFWSRLLAHTYSEERISSPMSMNTIPGNTGRIMPTMPARMNPQPIRSSASFFAVVRIRCDGNSFAFRC